MNQICQYDCGYRVTTEGLSNTERVSMGVCLRQGHTGLNPGWVGRHLNWILTQPHVVGEQTPAVSSKGPVGAVCLTQ